MTFLPPKTVVVDDSRWAGFSHYLGAEIHIVAGRQEERFDTTFAMRLGDGHAVACNVSANGIYFLTDVAVDPGARVTFTLDFQNFAGGPIQVNCVARVVRIEQQAGKKGVAAAIESFEFQLPRIAPLPQSEG